jgi:hypothetical protein
VRARFSSARAPRVRIEKTRGRHLRQQCELKHLSQRRAEQLPSACHDRRRGGAAYNLYTDASGLTVLGDGAEGTSRVAGGRHLRQLGRLWRRAGTTGSARRVVCRHHRDSGGSREADIVAAAVTSSVHAQLALANGEPFTHGRIAANGMVPEVRPSRGATDEWASASRNDVDGRACRFVHPSDLARWHWSRKNVRLSKPKEGHRRRRWH